MSHARSAVINDGRHSKAEKFFAKFGYGLITLDQFDMFIIDKGWADDPETDERSDPRHKVFVTERARQKRALDSAGPFIENPFQISVKTKGSEWEIEEWNHNAREISKDVGNRVMKFAKARMLGLQKLSSRASELKALTDDDSKIEELTETIALINYMADKSIELQTKVEAQCLKFNNAADAVEKQIKRLIAKEAAATEKLDEVG